MSRGIESIVPPCERSPHQVYRSLLRLAHKILIMHVFAAITALTPVVGVLANPIDLVTSSNNEVRNASPRANTVYCGVNGYQKEDPLQIIKNTRDPVKCASTCKKETGCKSYSVSQSRN